jgi:2'-5' RNA ligase
MPEPDPISAVVVRVRLPPALERLRERHDPAAALGVPAHVTLLYPFFPVIQLPDEARPALARIAADVRPFDARFTRVGRFPNVVYLVPDPSPPFARLTASIAGRFPAFPPYGGAFRAVVPHLTVADSDEAPLDAIASTVERFLPFTRRIEAIEVLVQRPGGPWRRRWRIPLGIRR